MNRSELYKLYEKLYFHEIESRDKITSRLQLPLAIFVSIFSVLGLMVRNINFDLGPIILSAFFLFLLISVIPVGLGVYYFIRGFYGHVYEYIPTAVDTEKYNQELIETYKEFENGENIAQKYLFDYLYKYYADCSSKNSNVNDKRSEFIHKSNFYIIVSILPLLITFLIFTFASIDKNEKEKVQEISIVNPLSVEAKQNPLGVQIVDSEYMREVCQSLKILVSEVKIMAEKDSTKKPPPPPPPPPKRLIREDVQIGSKKEKPDNKGDK